jgi:hypothetical protein
MSEIKHPAHLEEEVNPIEKLQLFWDKWGKQLTYAIVVIVLIVGGYIAYKTLISEPQEKKATEAMFRAEDYYRMDSARLRSTAIMSMPDLSRSFQSTAAPRRLIWHLSMPAAAT